MNQHMNDQRESNWLKSESFFALSRNGASAMFSFKASSPSLHPNVSTNGLQATKNALINLGLNFTMITIFTGCLSPSEIHLEIHQFSQGGMVAIDTVSPGVKWCLSFHIWSVSEAKQNEFWHKLYDFQILLATWKRLLLKRKDTILWVSERKSNHRNGNLWDSESLKAYLLLG